METIVWKIKGDLYEIYMRAISPFFKLTTLELSLATEMFREYNNFLLKSNHEIAWELLFSSKTFKRIREKLDISSAHFNNLKKSLKDKGVYNEKGFYKNIKLSNITFEFYEKQ